MKEIVAHLSIGYVCADHEEVMEFDDAATDTEIDEAVQAWAANYIETWWEPAEED